MRNSSAPCYIIEADDSIIWLQTMAACRKKIELLKTLKPDLDPKQKRKLTLALNHLDDVLGSVVDGMTEFCEDWEEMPGCKIWEVPVIIKGTPQIECAGV